MIPSLKLGISRMMVSYSGHLSNKTANPFKRFYGRSNEQAENCSLGVEETTLIRDTFILFLQQVN